MVDNNITTCLHALSLLPALQITAMAFSPDGATLTSADAAGVVTSWDLAAARARTTTPAHAGPVWSLAYSRVSGAVLASGGSDCTMRLWDAAAAGAAAGGEKAGAPALASLATWHTKATPVVAAAFSSRNLLLGAGPLSVRDAKKAA